MTHTILADEWPESNPESKKVTRQSKRRFGESLSE